MAGPSYPNGVDPNATPQPAPAPAAPDYNKDYWAPDRTQVLQSMGIQDTSGKQWNGTTWAAPTAGQTALAPNQAGQSGPWNGAGVPAGFDATKWNDPTKNDPKYDVGHMVASGWGNDQISQWMQSHPQEFAGYNVTGKDTITDAQGNVYDFRNGLGSDPNHQGTAQWTQVGGPGGGAPGGAQGIAGGFGTPGFGGIGGVGGQSGIFGLQSLFGQNGGAFDKLSNGLPYPSQGGDFYSQLLGKSTQSLNIDPQDPVMRQQFDAYDAAQQRSRRNYLADLAESSGPNSNLNEESRMTAENVGQNDAQFKGQLMQNELNSRRQEIMQTLQMQGQFLTQEQQLALQQELGIIDASLRQQQINSGNDQFNAQLGLNASQQANYWDAIRSGLING